jgi:hypothetical protein
MRAECQNWLGPNLSLRSLQVAFVVLLIAIWGGTIVQLIAKRIKAANAKLGLRVAEQIAYGLSLDTVEISSDILSTAGRNIQLGVALTNKTGWDLRYYVDAIHVEINGLVLKPEPEWGARGTVLYKSERTTFLYEPFRNMIVGTDGWAIVEINVSYGLANGRPVRHAQRAWNCRLFFNETGDSIISTIIQDNDEPIT